MPQVGTISANGDTEIGQLIARAMERVGKEGVITVSVRLLLPGNMCAVIFYYFLYVMGPPSAESLPGEFHTDMLAERGMKHLAPSQASQAPLTRDIVRFPFGEALGQLLTTAFDHDHVTCRMARRWRMSWRWWRA